MLKSSWYKLLRLEPKSSTCVLSHIGRLFFNLVGDGWDTLVQDALYDVEKEEENRVQLRRAIADGLRHQAQSRQRLRSKGARASFKVCACLHACLLACALPFLTSTVSATRSLTCCFSSSLPFRNAQDTWQLVAAGDEPACHGTSTYC